MKRRSFTLMAGTSLAGLKFGFADAQTAPDPSLLTTTLTPMGGERAGNADGSIPAWTGGYNTPPAGWRQGDFIPDPNESDAVVVKVDAQNMAQYSQFLSAGVAALMTKYPDFHVNVFPTHRTACAPQDVYDNIAKNAVSAKLDPRDPHFGFLNAVGGIPFPILNTSDPLIAGLQCSWNNYVTWRGRALVFRSEAYAVSNGSPYLSDASPGNYDYPYYHKGATQETFGGLGQRTFEQYTAPANDVGEEILTRDLTDPGTNSTLTWELLNGQGRVRKAPEVAYDTPASQVDGIANYDEYYGFTGSPSRFDWHYKGKKELFIPYNNNSLFALPANASIKPHFFDPETVRFEKHRVHVVEITLRAGYRNALPHRVIYFDEDTWTIAAVDTYDSAGALVHVGLVYFFARPDLPGTVIANNSVHDLQTGSWTPMAGPFDEKANPSYKFLDSLPDSMFDPNSMAASAQY